jgi:uncharacterized protein (DUF433 family)
VIRGTRITVEPLVRECAAGRSYREMVEDYPRVTEDDIRAAPAFAADDLADDVVM